MVTTLKSALGCEQFLLSVDAYGTSEGARKGWDARGRGRVKEVSHPKLWKSQRGEMTLSKRQIEHEQAKLKNRYEALGKKLDIMGRKLERIEDVNSLGGKLLHFMRRLGDWVEPFKNLAEMLVTAAMAVWGALHAYHEHVAQLHNIITWAYSHIAPVVHAATGVMR